MIQINYINRNILLLLYIRKCVQRIREVLKPFTVKEVMFLLIYLIYSITILDRD